MVTFAVRRAASRILIWCATRESLSRNTALPAAQLPLRWYIDDTRSCSRSCSRSSHHLPRLEYPRASMLSSVQEEEGNWVEGPFSAIHVRAISTARAAAVLASPAPPSFWISKKKCRINVCSRSLSCGVWHVRVRVRVRVRWSAAAM